MEFAKKYYPDWICRFYCSEDAKKLESLASLEFKLQQDLLKKSSEYVNLANFYLFKGLPIDSSKVIKKGLALGVLDNNIKHNELLSNAYIIAKDFDNAVNSLINVTKLSDDAKYDYRIGQIYLQNSDYKNAINSYEKAIQINPNLSELYKFFLFLL